MTYKKSTGYSPGVAVIGDIIVGIENTVILLLTAMIRNFYKFLMGRLDTKAFGMKKTSRIKAFVFRFISVPAKWIRTARHYELNIYTDNQSYLNPFALADG